MGDSFEHCRLWSGIPNLCLTDAKSSCPLTPPRDNQNISKVLPVVPEDHWRSQEHHSLLTSCIYLDLDLLCFISSQPRVTLLDVKTSLPLIIWPWYSLRLNFGLACWCLCSRWNTFASTFHQSLDSVPNLSMDFPNVCLSQICLWYQRQIIQPSGKETVSFLVTSVLVSAWLLSWFFGISFYWLNRFLEPQLPYLPNEVLISVLIALKVFKVYIR